jgi:hypothetical protein
MTKMIAVREANALFYQRFSKEAKPEHLCFTVQWLRPATRTFSSQSLALTQ